MKNYKNISNDFIGPINIDEKIICGYGGLGKNISGDKGRVNFTKGIVFTLFSQRKAYIHQYCKFFGVK